MGLGLRNLDKKVSIRERVVQGHVLVDRGANMDFAERFQVVQAEDEEEGLAKDGMKFCHERFCCPSASFLIASTIRSNWWSRLSFSR